MRKSIWLKTVRVYAYSNDGMPKIERVIVKLEDGNNFNKFCEHIHLKGYIKNEPPEIVKVLVNPGTKEEKEISKVPYQEKLSFELSKLKPTKAVDYKKEFEESQKANNEILSKFEALMNKVEDQSEEIKKLKTVEKTAERIELEKQAEKLGIKFRSTIGDEKLQEKINEKS